MSNYIYVSGEALWVFLALLAIIIIGFLIMGYSYLKAERDKQYYQERCHKLCRELSILQLSAISNEVKSKTPHPSPLATPSPTREGTGREVI